MSLDIVSLVPTLNLFEEPWNVSIEIFVKYYQMS